jgi:uncharacterized protein
VPSFRPPQPESIVVPGPAGGLEALLEALPGSGSAPVGLVCHPHPLHGGTLRNKVVHTLARSMHMLGMSTVRFNYRGVEGSDGAYDDGVGETEDALAVAAWMHAHWPDSALWLAGFSFGSAVALRAALRLAVERLVMVAPPVAWLPDANALPDACDWLVVHGSDDELIGLAAVEQWMQTLRRPPELRVLKGADHFFHGRLGELRDLLHAWVGARV